MNAATIGLFIVWLVWTYFVYQCGYHNASKDAEAIAGRKLWAKQDAYGARSDTRQLKARVGHDAIRQDEGDGHDERFSQPIAKRVSFCMRSSFCACKSSMIFPACMSATIRCAWNCCSCR